MNVLSPSRSAAQGPGPRVIQRLLGPLMLATFVVLSLAQPSAVSAQEPAREIPNSRCLGCHDDDTLTSDDGRSMP